MLLSWFEIAQRSRSHVTFANKSSDRFEDLCILLRRTPCQI